MSKPAVSPDDLPEVMDVTEAAALLRCATSTVCDGARDGTIPGRKIGKEWRFWKRALLECLGSPSGTPEVLPFAAVIDQRDEKSASAGSKLHVARTVRS